METKQSYLKTVSDPLLSSSLQIRDRVEEAELPRPLLHFDSFLQEELKKPGQREDKESDDDPNSSYFLEQMIHFILRESDIYKILASEHPLTGEILTILQEIRAAEGVTRKLPFSLSRRISRSYEEWSKTGYRNSQFLYLNPAGTKFTATL